MIPIDFPTWVQPAFYAFLLLLGLNVFVGVWNIIAKNVINQKLDEILSKTRLIMLNRRIEDEGYYYDDSSSWEREEQ